MNLVLSSLISSEIQSTVTNIFYDQPHVCGKQLDHEDVGPKNVFKSTDYENIKQLQVEVLEVG
jgi:hypothetical protein